MTLRSSLAGIVGPAGASHPDEVRAMAKRAWQNGKTAMINLDWLTCEDDRKALTRLADKVHGRRLSGSG